MTADKADGGRRVAKDDWKGAAAANQLDRVLSFFPRVESKVSSLFATDTAMLALLALNARAQDLNTWYVGVPNVLAIVAITASLYFLYQASFPQLKGGAKSLIYFREIASMTEATYIDSVRSCDEDLYTKELLTQVWRNSEILTMKFDALKYAFWCTASALLPWLGALLAAALTHPALTVS